MLSLAKDTGRGINHLQSLLHTPFCIMMISADAPSFLTAPHCRGWWALTFLQVHLSSHLCGATLATMHDAQVKHKQGTCLP